MSTEPEPNPQITTIHVSHEEEVIPELPQSVADRFPVAGPSSPRDSISPPITTISAEHQDNPSIRTIRPDTSGITTVKVESSGITTLPANPIRTIHRGPEIRTVNRDSGLLRFIKRALRLQ